MDAGEEGSPLETHLLVQVRAGQGTGLGLRGPLSLGKGQASLLRSWVLVT